MRVLILYPTNALADDQLVRLRKSLDSREAHAWLDRKRNGHRFYFGRYTGATPVSGSRDSEPANFRLRQYLREVQERQRKADEKLDEELRPFIPRLGGAEMHARWDMQAAPPDVMVTNYSMLNIMLLRKQEEHVFSATRKWLEETPDARFTLILDELHMYRGTAGTEVAYLLRNLRHRLGLDKSPEKFRVLAASASLEAGRDDEFLDGFFALPSSRRVIIPGKANEIHGEGGLAAHAERLAQAAKAPVTQDEAVALARDTGLGPALQRALTPDGKPRALPAPALAKNLFPDVPEEQRQESLHGVLRVLGSAQDPELPQLRAHFFFRNIEGIWACSDPNCPDIPVEHGPERRVGRLFADPTSRCTCGAAYWSSSPAKPAATSCSAGTPAPRTPSGASSPVPSTPTSRTWTYSPTKPAAHPPRRTTSCTGRAPRASASTAPTGTRACPTAGRRSSSSSAAAPTSPPPAVWRTGTCSTQDGPSTSPCPWTRKA